MAGDVTQLIALLRRELRVDGPIEADTPLVSSGVVDSFNLAGLLQAIDAQYRVRITLPEIGVDNFDTPRQMSAFIQSRQ